MSLSRRTFLGGMVVLPHSIGGFGVPAAAQSGPTQQGAMQIPPMLFVHGNGDHAALWITTLWRMESNGIARDRMFALDFTNPQARADDAVAQPDRSSTEDQRRELAKAVNELKRRTGAPRIALVASSRGGNAVRNFIKAGGGGDVSHAVLCGTPNHGISDWDDSPGNEFNGRGPFLRGLNAGETEVTPGTAFLTLRSDGYDKYAQPDGRFLGKPGTPTGITSEGPALRGASNLAIGTLDHREVAFHPRAFREIYRFVAGREPDRIAITPEPRVTLSGLVTAMPGGVPTNRPITGASVAVYRVSPESGERLGDALQLMTTADGGRWGPVQVDPSWYLEMVLTVDGSPITHIYRSPFPRSSDVVHLRPGRALLPADREAGAVVIMARPRGYFGIPRDIVLLDGKEPADVKPGVPTDWVTTLRLPHDEAAGRAVTAIFNEERIVARAWPVSENRISIAELTY